MAETPVPLRIDLDLANADREISEQLVIQTARHPSETTERVWLRILAFAWQWQPSLTLGAGLANTDEPDLAATDPTGAVTAMVFVGKPEPRRVAKIRSRAARAAVAILFESAERLAAYQRACEAEDLTARLADVELAAVEPALLRALSAWDDRRMRVSITLAGDTFYLLRDEQDLSGPLLRP